MLFFPFYERWLEKPVFIRRRWRPIIAVNIWHYSRDTSIFSAFGICFMPKKYVNLGFSSLRTWILNRHWRLLRFINICNLGLSPLFFWDASVGLSFPSFYSFLAVVFILVARPGAYHFHTSLSPLHLWIWYGLPPSSLSVSNNGRSYPLYRRHQGSLWNSLLKEYCGT